MNDFTRKNDPDVNILRKQILQEARLYTDQAVFNLSQSLQDSTAEEEDEMSSSPSLDDLFNGSILQPLPPGEIEQVLFLNDDEEFTYNESYKYGNLYINSDGDYVVDVTAKVTTNKDSVSGIEIQVTRIDDEG